MTNETFELSRRKTLAAIGSIGVASAGAGLGTSAYFSDEERIQNNVLTAGSLDLKLDWQEHYSDWSPDEEEFASMGTAENHDYELPGGEVGESIYIDFADDGGKQGFLDATGKEAYPDDDDDGIQTFPTGWFGPEDSPNYICNIGADTPEDLDPTQSLRTLNEDTYDTANEAYKPLVNISDVKPGDFGEVTFSLHLCDNPGFVWMFTENVAWAENGEPDPEEDDSDSEGPADESGSTTAGDDLSTAQVELLDALQARAWYDTNGDNLKDDNEIPIVEGSFREVVTQLTTDPGVKLRAPCFAGVDILNGDGDAGGDGILDSSTFTCEPSSPLGQPSNPNCESFGFDGVRFDESELPDADGNYHTLTKTFELEGDQAELSVEIKVTDEDGGDPQRFQFRNLQVRTLPDGSFVTAGTCLVLVKGGPRANKCVPEEPTAGGGDHVFESPVNQGGNVPAISHLDFCICEVDDDDNGGPGPVGDPSDCITNSNTYFVGFEWWLPIDHGNEVQTDSVSFDLGFYTEQCRHNDGSGMSREENSDDGPGGPTRT